MAMPIQRTLLSKAPNSDTDAFDTDMVAAELTSERVRCAA